MARIGLYGGSFDPVHLGHLLVAQAAIEELGLDRLYFIPATQSPFKPTSVPAPGHIRCRLLRLALAGLSAVEVDDLELRRGGVSYSIDTARAYAGRHRGATLHWLIGADHVAALPRWREAEALASLVEFVVIPRPGSTPVALPPVFRLRELRGHPLAVSSSDIRARIQRGQAFRHLVPGMVGEAIATDGLYAREPGPAVI